MCKIKKIMLIMTVLCVAFSSISASAGDDDIIEKVRELASDKHGGVVLALGGGGTKGFAHIGVLKVLEEMNVPVVGIVGTSIGAIIGGLYSSGMDADSIRDAVTSTNIMALLADRGTRTRSDAGDHMPMGENGLFFKLKMNKEYKQTGPRGVLAGTSLLEFLNQYTANVRTTNFMRLPIPFACVAADICTGETVVLKSGSLASAMRASMSIPGLVEPWPIDGHLLVDGGIVSNLPVKIAKDLFPGYPVIAVNLSGRETSISPDQLTSMFDVLMQTIDVMSIERLEENKKAADLVIYPDNKGLSMLDSGGYDEIYDRGIRAAAENAAEINKIAMSAPRDRPNPAGPLGVRYVKEVRVTGLRENAAEEIVRYCSVWVGNPYDPQRVNQTARLLMQGDDIETVDVETVLLDDEPDKLDIVLHVEKRPAFEMSVEAYSSNLHSQRWIGSRAVWRDIASEGDSLITDLRWGNEDGGARLRYFTPMTDRHQWGFALSAGRDRQVSIDTDEYLLNRFSGRILRYAEFGEGRLGYGLAAEHTDTDMEGVSNFVWGPYLYFNYDTFDNDEMPTSGFSIDSRIWYNSESILVSKSNVSAYIPTRLPVHIILKGGLKTGDHDSKAYRALLGSNEELFSLARHPYAGDQAAWVHLGAEREFFKSWWGAIRGEVFAKYGLVMDDWKRQKDAWEVGVALSSPGHFLDGRLLFIYGQEGEFTLGFTIGKPNWWTYELP